MIALNRRTKIFVCKEPTDMRASYDSLFARARDVLKKDPRSGHLFLFVSRARSSCKALYYDGTGFVILSKRLERGQFSRINPMFPSEVVLTEAEFGLFFEGANLEKRFIDSPAEFFIKTHKSRTTNAAPDAAVIPPISDRNTLQTKSM
jgi:transposase